MCTAITYRTRDWYFGRTLDLEYAYDEQVTVMPRRFPLEFRHMGRLEAHYAIIGMAYVAEGYPLYYDAANEKGLWMAGLNFPGNAVYHAPAADKDNIAPFELIPWLLGQCETVEQAQVLLERMQLTSTHFSPKLPLTPLHWMLADTTGACMVVECTADGLHLYDDPAGVLTNNPPFAQQMTHLANYMHLTAQPPANTFAPGLTLEPYSRGMGAMGLPGDLSSPSRFVRAAFARGNGVSGEGEQQSVSQFFHMLDTVTHPRGCVQLGDGQYQITVYTACCNADRGIYYYTTYENRQICAVDMHQEALDGEALIAYPLRTEQQIFYQN